MDEANANATDYNAAYEGSVGVLTNANFTDDSYEDGREFTADQSSKQGQVSDYSSDSSDSDVEHSDALTSSPDCKQTSDALTSSPDCKPTFSPDCKSTSVAAVPPARNDATFSVANEEGDGAAGGEALSADQQQLSVEELQAAVSSSAAEELTFASVSGTSQC